MTLTDENGLPLYTNRLSAEDSPYLRQHAHNPVNWFPWGDDAFAEAKTGDKPIFLSIGYSTCHWCHVMERESFDNLEIAELLNRNFVPVKLDREQRPDIDEIYMTGTQLMSGHGGWPMSNFLTPEGKPFFSGTYFPPESFRDLIKQLDKVWKTRRTEIYREADRISEAIARHTNARGKSEELGDILRISTEALLDLFDNSSGGFGSSPKFPQESHLLLLLESWKRNKGESVRNALRLTLDQMYQGGIYDQVAGGFHRYAVDNEWQVPHFEKMLYNQAQLLHVYALAYSRFNLNAYKRVANEIAEYVLREMTSSEGAFYSATDADSEGEEGLFFTWTFEELENELSDDDLAFVMEVYGVTRDGNFEGKNILHLKNFPDLNRKEDSDDWLKHLSVIKAKLYSLRTQRLSPLRDEKIITGWNSMMISALVIAGHLLQSPKFLQAAERAADYLWTQHRREGVLWRISFNGNTSIKGNLEDYGSFAAASMSLFKYTAKEKWLDRARLIIQEMNALFWDMDDAGYFFSSIDEAKRLITRPKSPMDGATPSANSYAVSALVCFWLVTKDIGTEEKINRTIKQYSGLITSAPTAFSYMSSILQDYLTGQRDSIQYAANGHVRASLHKTVTGRTLELNIDQDWYINANKTTGSFKPTFITGKNIHCRYPLGTTRTPSFTEEPSNFYEGKITIDIVGEGPISLNLQACDKTSCLVPELLTFD